MKRQQESDVYFAISDSTRRGIMDLLSQGNLALKDITCEFTITRTAVSKHLKILSDAKLIESEKSGRETIYRLSPTPLIEVREWLHYYDKFWEDKLSKLKNFVESNNE